MNCEPTRVKRKLPATSVVLTLFLISKQGGDGIDREKIKAFTESKNTFIRQMALCAMNMEHHEPGKMEDTMETEISIPDKILRLKGINIFEGLSVGELAAIASVTSP